MTNKEKKRLKVKVFNFTSKFEDEYNSFVDEHPHIKSIQFKKMDKWSQKVFVWYWEVYND